MRPEAPRSPEMVRAIRSGASGPWQVRRHDPNRVHNETPVGLHVRQAALPLGWKQ